jgi:hypothetical protein
MGLTLDEHREVGAMLKRARALLLDASAIVGNYERQSRQLRNAANALRAPRDWLAQRLISEVGEAGAKEVYFGREVEDG